MSARSPPQALTAGPESCKPRPRLSPPKRHKLPEGQAIVADSNPSSKSEELSLICEEDSELSATAKPGPGVCRNLSKKKIFAQRNIYKKKKGIKPFWCRSPSLQQRKEFAQSNARYTMCSRPTETNSEFSVSSEVFPSLLLSLESELLVDSSTSTRTDSCSSLELFREAEELKDVGWFSCKNSTLLDNSKATNIDVIAQPSNVSEILEPTENIRREGSFKNSVTDATEVCGNIHPALVRVAGKTISKLQPGSEQKGTRAISIPSKQKNINQDEVPVCSIILAPVCYRPAKVWQYEQPKPCTTFENAPLDIIISPT
ncbi:uncharacterized protein LOC144600027 [Rhinoraja longicauda]